MHRGRYSKAPPFVWRNDSKAILGVRQDTMRPSGFALGPLSPIEIPNDGEPHPLPLLKDVAGGLDGMIWVGNSGLALAEFGKKGDRESHRMKTRSQLESHLPLSAGKNKKH